MKRLLIILALMSSPAHAHEWYDTSCCSEKDCEPLPEGAVTVSDKGYHVKYVGKEGYHVDVLVPFDQTKPSQDEFFHGCAGWDRFICLYVPGTS